MKRSRKSGSPHWTISATGSSVRRHSAWFETDCRADNVRHNDGMKIIRNLVIVAALSAVALATSACPEKGPAEKAGEKIDKAIDKTKDAVKDGK